MDLWTASNTPLVDSGNTFFHFRALQVLIVLFVGTANVLFDTETELLHVRLTTNGDVKSDSKL